MKSISYLDDGAYFDDMARESSSQLLTSRYAKKVGRFMLIVFGLFLIMLFLPWRQTIPGRGVVTALRPEDRSQTIQNQIGGRIEYWAVMDGEAVQKGDTILVISETTQSYFDPELPQRLTEQLGSAQGTEQAATEQMEASRVQLQALSNGLRLQLAAAENRVSQRMNVVTIDSADLQAVKKFYETSQARLLRYEEGYKNGLFSLTDIETRRLKLQEDYAKVVSAQNKLSNSKQDLVNAKIDLDNIRATNQEARARVQSGLSSAFSGKVKAQGDISKLRNEISNVAIRQGLYVVRAPQSGFVVKTLKAGVGENIKEGESVATLQPEQPQVAVEMYVDAMDVPLIDDTSDVRLQFEGWPSVQFSGWPAVAVGTFAGKVAVIDRVSSVNGKYRLLIKQTLPTPDPDDPWPDRLRQGSGVFGRVILRSVPVWYEIWRQLNGFPPSLETEPSGPK